MLDRLGRAGRGEVVSLGPVAAECHQLLRLGCGLDPFGDDGHAEGVGQVDDRSDDRGFGAASELGDERPVDLDEVKGNMRR